MNLGKDELVAMRTKAFLSGKKWVYNTVRQNPRFVGVHIAKLDVLRKELKDMGYKFRVRYRGPRVDAHRAFTAKADAKAFSIYFE